MDQGEKGERGGALASLRGNRPPIFTINPAGAPAGRTLENALAVCGTAGPPYGAMGTVFWLTKASCLTTNVMGDPLLALRRRTCCRRRSASPSPASRRFKAGAWWRRLPHVIWLRRRKRVTHAR